MKEVGGTVTIIPLFVNRCNVKKKLSIMQRNIKLFSHLHHVEVNCSLYSTINKLLNAVPTKN